MRVMKVAGTKMFREIGAHAVPDAQTLTHLYAAGPSTGPEAFILFVPDAQANSGTWNKE